MSGTGIPKAASLEHWTGNQIRVSGFCLPVKRRLLPVPVVGAASALAHKAQNRFSAVPGPVAISDSRPW